MKQKCNLTQQQMKEQGYPTIKYSINGSEWVEKSFYTKKSCKIRTQDLLRRGFEVIRVQ